MKVCKLIAIVTLLLCFVHNAFASTSLSWEKEIYKSGTLSFEECMSTFNGKLMGCLLAKHKISRFKSEDRYFPGVETAEKCAQIREDKKISNNANVTYFCSQYESKFWVLDSKYEAPYRSPYKPEKTLICTPYGNKLICK